MYYICILSGSYSKETISIFKSNSHLPKKISFILFNESLLKIMKNTFYFTLQALFVLRIFKFLSWICGHTEKQLDEKDFKILISKFMTSQPRKQTIAIHALLGSSGNKGNQTMKFNQLIEYTMRKIFLKNCTENVVEKLFPNLFQKILNWAYPRIVSIKFYKT